MLVVVCFVWLMVEERGILSPGWLGEEGFNERDNFRRKES